MKSNRDPRWSKQFGDFGEQLVLYVIGQLKNMKVAYVDHAGADLIATDLGNSSNRYAISVKSKTMNLDIRDDGYLSLESKLFPFDGKNIGHLQNFAENFDLKPTVAMVMVEPAVPQDHPKWVKKKENAEKNHKYFKDLKTVQINVFIFTLEDALEMAKDPNISYFSPSSDGGFNFKFEDEYFPALINDPRIDYTHLTFDTLENARQWDPSSPMHENADDYLPW